MNNILSILIAALLFSLGSVKAFSDDTLLQPMFVQTQSEETFEASFSEEPSEFGYQLTDCFYRTITASQRDKLDDDDDEKDLLLLIDFSKFLPKQFRLFLTLDCEGNTSQFLTASTLLLTQEEVVEGITNALVEWQESCGWEENAQWDEEYHLTFTPLQQEETGHYSSNLFYSSLDTYEEGNEEERYFWAKIVITPTNLYIIGLASSTNNEAASQQAENFISSLRITHHE